MNAYEDFMSICNWQEETLEEQRERIMKSLLTPEQYKKREEFFNSNNKVTEIQLSLF